MWRYTHYYIKIKNDYERNLYGMQQVFTYLLQNFGPFGLILIVIGFVGWFLIKELRKSNASLIEKQHQYNKQMTEGISNSITKLSEKLKLIQ